MTHHLVTVDTHEQPTSDVTRSCLSLCQFCYCSIV